MSRFFFKVVFETDFRFPIERNLAVGRTELAYNNLNLKKNVKKGLHLRAS